MEQRKLTITKIPAVLYGTASPKCFLYIHGKFGLKEEAESFAEIAGAKGWQVLSIDLPEHGERKEENDRFNPWCVIPELKTVLRYVQQNFKTIGLRAASIGAWFAMESFDGSEFETCLFVSPVLDMEKLIQNMMRQASVSEEKLKKESLIPTDFGETLSWKYYEYAKAHPITEWRCRTDILYAGNDNMTARKTVDEFMEQCHASLTVMENGEHWFHTPEQLAILNQWTKERVEYLGEENKGNVEIVEIKERTPLLLLQLLELWEKSVRATHLFLSDEEIGAIKEAVPAALKGIPHLIVAENEKIPAAFMGIDGKKLEMLFVSAEERGKGIGKKLLEYGIEKFAIRELAVNEDNPLAKEFYEHMGFEVFKRTDHDEQGNPYPLLYMKLHTCKGVMDHENAGKKY